MAGGWDAGHKLARTWRYSDSGQLPAAGSGTAVQTSGVFRPYAELLSRRGKTSFYPCRFFFHARTTERALFQQLLMGQDVMGDCPGVRYKDKKDLQTLPEKTITF